MQNNYLPELKFNLLQKNNLHNPINCSLLQNYFFNLSNKKTCSRKKISARKIFSKYVDDSTFHENVNLNSSRSISKNKIYSSSSKKKEFEYLSKVKTPNISINFSTTTLNSNKTPEKNDIPKQITKFPIIETYKGLSNKYAKINNISTHNNNYLFEKNLRNFIERTKKLKYDQEMLKKFIYKKHKRRTMKTMIKKNNTKGVNNTFDGFENYYSEFKHKKEVKEIVKNEFEKNGYQISYKNSTPNSIYLPVSNKSIIYEKPYLEFNHKLQLCHVLKDKEIMGSLLRENIIRLKKMFLNYQE